MINLSMRGCILIILSFNNFFFQFPLFSFFSLKAKSRPRFRPQKTFPHFGGFPTTFSILCSFLIGGHFNFFWPFFSFGHKIGIGVPKISTHIKKFDPLMSIPIEKEHPVKILVGIGPIDCWDPLPRSVFFTSKSARMLKSEGALLPSQLHFL